MSKKTHDASWLDRCHRRGLITKDQHKAGKHLRAAFGKSTGAQKSVDEAKAALASHSRRAADEIVNLCKYDRRPCVGRDTSMVRVREGLDILVGLAA